MTCRVASSKGIEIADVAARWLSRDTGKLWPASTNPTISAAVRRSMDCPRRWPAIRRAKGSGAGTRTVDAGRPAARLARAASQPTSAARQQEPGIFEELWRLSLEPVADELKNPTDDEQGGGYRPEAPNEERGDEQRQRERDHRDPEGMESPIDRMTVTLGVLRDPLLGRARHGMDDGPECGEWQQERVRETVRLVRRYPSAEETARSRRGEGRADGTGRHSHRVLRQVVDVSDDRPRARRVASQGSDVRQETQG